MKTCFKPLIPSLLLCAFFLPLTANSNTCDSDQNCQSISTTSAVLHDTAQAPADALPAWMEQIITETPENIILVDIEKRVPRIRITLRANSAADISRYMQQIKETSGGHDVSIMGMKRIESATQGIIEVEY